MTSLGVRAYLSSVQQTVPVLIAVTEIPARAEVTAEMIKVVHVRLVDRNQLFPDGFWERDSLVGRYARRRIEPGEVLRDRPGDFTTHAEFVMSGAEMPLAETLPVDTRALTISMDRQAVLDHHVRAGDLVDLIFTSKSDSTGGVYASSLIHQVYVLDIRHPSANEIDTDILVTLLVTPEQAVYVALAKRTGTIDLALSSPERSEAAAPVTASPLQFIHRAEPVSAEEAGR